MEWTQILEIQKASHHNDSYAYCRFSYAEIWELVKLIVGTKLRRSHVCLHSHARIKLWQLMTLLFLVML